MLTQSKISESSNTIFSGSSSPVFNAPIWLPKADFSRTETDLIATNADGKEVVFVDYFTSHDLPSIQTENGLLLKGSLLKERIKIGSDT